MFTGRNACLHGKPCAILALILSTSPAIRVRAADRFLPCRTCRRRKVTTLLTTINNEIACEFNQCRSGAKFTGRAHWLPVCIGKLAWQPSNIVGDAVNRRVIDVSSTCHRYIRDSSACVSSRAQVDASCRRLGWADTQISRSRYIQHLRARDGRLLLCRRGGRRVLAVRSCEEVPDRPTPVRALRRAVQRSRAFRTAGTCEVGRGPA